MGRPLPRRDLGAPARPLRRPLLPEREPAGALLPPRAVARRPADDGRGGPRGRSRSLARPGGDARHPLLRGAERDRGRELQPDAGGDELAGARLRTRLGPRRPAAAPLRRAARGVRPAGGKPARDGDEAPRARGRRADLLGTSDAGRNEAAGRNPRASPRPLLRRNVRPGGDGGTAARARNRSSGVRTLSASIVPTSRFSGASSGCRAKRTRGSSPGRATTSPRRRVRRESPWRPGRACSAST